MCLDTQTPIATIFLYAVSELLYPCTHMVLLYFSTYACGFGKRLDRYLDLMRAPPDVRMLTGICRVYMLYSKSDSSYCSLLSNVVHVEFRGG